MRSKLFKYLMVIIFGMFLCGILIYLWGIPTIGHIITQNFPEFSYCYYPWLIFLWCTGIPCFIVLGYIGQYSKADIPEHTQYDTESLAKFAFSMFWQAMCFADEQQVPILMDF